MKDWSVLVNQSKNILTDVLKRAEYLLELHGSVKPSEEADSLDNTDLLMEIMEVREQLEEAQTAEGIESIKQTNKLNPRSFGRTGSEVSYPDPSGKSSR